MLPPPHRCENHLESVRKLYFALHNLLSMSLIEAKRRNASAFWLRFSQSLASQTVWGDVYVLIDDGINSPSWLDLPLNSPVVEEAIQM